MPDGAYEIPPSLSDDELNEATRRYEFERQYYSARWATFVEPNFSREQEWSKFAIDFATFGVKSLTTLNGGAIFFIGPAFSWLGAKLERTDFFVALALFSFGLLAALFALVCGFFACARRAEGFALRANKEASNANTQFINADTFFTALILQKEYQPRPFDSSPDGTEEKKDAYNSWRSNGIHSIFISASMFLFGMSWSIWAAN